MLFSFWRWLTCGHDRHRWFLHAALDLRLPERVWEISDVYAVRTCHRCGLTEIIE